MKKRNLIIIAVVIVLGIVTAVVFSNKSKNHTFEQDYHIENVNTITKIFMSDKLDNSVLLTRAEDDTTWVVNGKYPASQGKMDLLLETLNQMRIRQKVNRNAVRNIVKNLSVSSTKVEVYQEVPFINWFGGKLQLFKREKLVATYYVGHETQDNMGTYVFREGDDEPCVVHIPGFRGFLGPRFESVPDLWRSHRIVDLPVTDIQSVKVEIPSQPQESFEVRRHNDDGFDFYMQNQMVPAFDTVRVAQLLSSFVNLNFDQFAGVVPKVELDTTFSREPSFRLSVTSTKGETRSLCTYVKFTNPDLLMEEGAKDKYIDFFDVDRLYAILDTKDTVLIQYYVFDDILQPASFFLGKGSLERSTRTTSK